MKNIVLMILVEIFINFISMLGVYYLWNWLMPELIMAKEISLLQAWGVRTLVQFCVWFRPVKKDEDSNL
jgi:hypothetical protein